jgi:glycosyltransferase involved in cell wall biosynthesis
VTKPAMGVLAYGPIQYHTPLYQRLAARGNVDIDVLYLSDNGYRPRVDPGFGVPVAWDIDLLSGYPHRFLAAGERPAGRAARLRALARWIPSHDVVVVNGYYSPWMLSAMALCRLARVPYLLRASAHPQGPSRGLRRHLRRAGTRIVVAGSAGGLSMGVLNDEFYRLQRARRIVFAPNSVDNDRFAVPSPVTRSELLARYGLRGDTPLILCCGKLCPRKRPQDLAAAVKLLRRRAAVLFVGDGSMAGQIRSALGPGEGAVTGFVNQADLPSFYQAADVLAMPSEFETWGLVINEAMAAGVLPVASDRVGAVPDLVEGIGEVHPCGDVAALAAALVRALTRAATPGKRDRVARHVARYRLELTAIGFEQGALDASRGRQSRHRSSPAGRPRHIRASTAREA